MEKPSTMVMHPSKEGWNTQPEARAGCFTMLECSPATFQSCETFFSAALSGACPAARRLLASPPVSMTSSEATPYILSTSIMGVLFVAGMIRLWLLRRVEEKLLKNKEALEKQIVTQQKDLHLTRTDANAWRAEMQRQFDAFRHMASDQLKVEESRFDNLLVKSREREHALQTSLDISRQMCAELPSTKARLMQLEALLGIDAGEGLTSGTIHAVSSADDLAPMPDLNGAPAEASTPPAPACSPSAGTTDHNPAQAHELESLRQQNAALQQALTAERLRARIKERSYNGTKAKNRRN